MLTQWNPFHQIEEIHREINRLFEHTGGHYRGLGETRYPLMDVSQTDDEVKIRLLVPGLDKDDITINLHENVVTISGQIKEAPVPDGARQVRQERATGMFQRTLRLQKPVEDGKIEAALRDGVLTVTLPYKEEARPKQIDIAVN